MKHMLTNLGQRGKNVFFGTKEEYLESGPGFGAVKGGD